MTPEGMDKYQESCSCGSHLLHGSKCIPIKYRNCSFRIVGYLNPKETPSIDVSPLSLEVPIQQKTCRQPRGQTAFQAEQQHTQAQAPSHWQQNPTHVWPQRPAGADENDINRSSKCVFCGLGEEAETFWQGFIFHCTHTHTHTHTHTRTQMP